MNWHHLLVNGQPMCKARMEIRHAAKGCEYPNELQALNELHRLKGLFPAARITAACGECPAAVEDHAAACG